MCLDWSKPKSFFFKSSFLIWAWFKCPTGNPRCRGALFRGPGRKAPHKRYRTADSSADWYSPTCKGPHTFAPKKCWNNNILLCGVWADGVWVCVVAIGPWRLTNYSLLSEEGGGRPASRKTFVLSLNEKEIRNRRCMLCPILFAPCECAYAAKRGSARVCLYTAKSGDEITYLLLLLCLTIAFGMSLCSLLLLPSLSLSLSLSLRTVGSGDWESRPRKISARIHSKVIKRLYLSWLSFCENM